MKGILIMLLITATLASIKTFSWNPGTDEDNEVEIIDLRWPDDAASMGRIPEEESLTFKNAQVDMLPQNFTDRFKKCIRMHFSDSSVRSIHVSPTLLYVSLYNTSTENILIERRGYQLERLVCNTAALTRIPENINQLQKLQYLVLSMNLIETVQLDQLNGLDKLKFLDLSSNKIKRIYNHESVRLPSLAYLHLESNQLKHLDVCRWLMPSLSYLGIDFNKLTQFAINHFRGLKQLYMRGNRLNCAWRDSLLNDTKSDRNISVASYCDNESEGFVLDCTSTIGQLWQPIDHLQQQSSILASKLVQIEGKLLSSSQQFSYMSNKMQKTEAEINKRLQKIETLLEKLNGKIIEQQNVSNDIIEAFYRSEMERTVQTEPSP